MPVPSGKVHFWIEYFSYAVCGQRDSPVRRSSRRIEKVTCVRCQMWRQRNLARLPDLGRPSV